MTYEDERKFAADLFEVVRSVSVEGGGVTRASYSPSETAAMRVLGRAASKIGLAQIYDTHGNAWFWWPASSEKQPRIITGSHVDSVKCGGNYDGLAGVVAALIAVRRLGPELPVCALALRGEEGAWFDQCYKGSLSLFGKLRAPLSLETSGMHAAMRQCSVETCPSGWAPDMSLARAFIELHIEQGPVLEAAKEPIGIVTAIRGNVRFRVRCVGEAGHSGTVPMGMRKDAVFAAARFISCLEEDWIDYADPKTDCAITCGILSTDPATHAITRIADRVDFTVECRSVDADVLRAFAHDIESERFSRIITAERGVRFEILGKVVTAPAELQSGLIVAPSGTRLMPSGAGHDAAVFAQAGVPTGMIFVRNANGSHNPAESMDLVDFMIGVDALETTLRRVVLRTAAGGRL